MIYLTIIIVVLLAYIGFREWLSHKERGEFTKKLMAKSYYEYMAGNAMKPNRGERKERKEDREKKNKEENKYKDIEDLSSDEQDRSIKAMAETEGKG